MKLVKFFMMSLIISAIGIACSGGDPGPTALPVPTSSGGASFAPTMTPVPATVAPEPTDTPAPPTATAVPAPTTAPL